MIRGGRDQGHKARQIVVWTHKREWTRHAGASAGHKFSLTTEIHWLLFFVEMRLCKFSYKRAGLRDAAHVGAHSETFEQTLMARSRSTWRPRVYVARADASAGDTAISVFVFGFRNAMAITPPTSATIPQTKKPWWYPSATETALSTALPMMYGATIPAEVPIALLIARIAPRRDDGVCRQ